MKEYLIPISIIVGAIIMSITIFLATTSHDRKAYDFCMENIKGALEDRNIKECKSFIYNK